MCKCKYYKENKVNFGGVSDLQVVNATPTQYGSLPLPGDMSSVLDMPAVGSVSLGHPFYGGTSGTLFIQNAMLKG